jgi:tetratricopeptide (TPR) repeat protein
MATPASTASASEIHYLLLSGNYEAACAAAEAAIASETLAPADHARVLLDWVRASTAIDHMEDAAEHLAEALALIPQYTEDALAQEIRLELGRVLIMQGNLRQGLDMCQKIAAEALSGGPHLQARAGAICGWAYMRMRRFKEAVEALAPAREFYLAHPDQYGGVQCEHWYAWSAIGAGLIEEGLAIAEAQLGRLNASDDPNPYALSTVLNTLTFGEFCRGNLLRVSDLAQKKLEVENLIGSKPRIQVMLYNMALLAIQVGDFAAARDRLRRCWALTQELPDQRFSVELAKLLAIVAIHDGEPQQALDYARLGQEHLRSLGLEAEQTYDWYMALSLLAAGYCDQADVSWRRRRAYEPSHENWLELQLLRAALDRIAEPSFPRTHASSAEVTSLATAWLSDLLQEQRRMPRPAAVESGQFYGTIDPTPAAI